MTHRLDTLQIVFDRTDWRELARQKRALLAAMNCLDPRAHPHMHEELESFVRWIDVIQKAAKMDGYQIEEKEPTR